MILKVVSLIPVYKKIEFLNYWELQSIKITLLKVSEHFDFFFIGPQNICQEYKSYFGNSNYCIFNTYNFKSIEGYNNLLKSKLFYKKFNDYDYLLIIQPDSLILGNPDEIFKFKEFDYYGAPSINKGVIRGYNGGFSLRNVKKSIEVLNSYKRTESWKEISKRHFYKPTRYILIWKWLSVLFDFFIRKIVASPFNRFEKGNEDLFWTVDVPKAVPSFKVNDFETAIKFSWEHQCTEFYNKYPLPFGCHGWWNYNHDFWKDIIKIDERQD